MMACNRDSREFGYWKSAEMSVSSLVELPGSESVWTDPPVAGPSTLLDVTVLLPNGILLLMPVHGDITLQDLKEEVWEEARLYPLFGSLREPQAYGFVCVNASTAEQEEVANEARRLADVRPFQFVLKLAEKKPDAADRHLNAQIGLLIDKGLHEFESLRDPEVTEFRWKMRSLSESLAQKRERQSWLGKLLYQSPLRLHKADSEALLKDKTRDGLFVVAVRFHDAQNTHPVKLYASAESTADDLLREALARASSADEDEALSGGELLLKVFGREEFLLEGHPLVHYKYIREMIADEKVPELVIINSSQIQLEVDSEYESLEEVRVRTCNSFYGSATLGRSGRGQQQQSGGYGPVPGQQGGEISAWSLPDHFSVTVMAADRINCLDINAKVCVHACVYHGGEPLCEPLWSAEVTVIEGRWPPDRPQPLDFGLLIRDLPRMARLCLAIVQLGGRAAGKVKKAKGAKQESNQCMALAWGNTMVYDFRNQLKSGGLTLHLWPCTVNKGEMTDGQLLSPLGTVASNLSQGPATTLTLAFKEFGRPVCYPSFEKVIECAADSMKSEDGAPCQRMPHASKSHLEQLRQICDKDSLHQLHEQEKELLWFLRQDCCHLLPGSLPKLLRSLKWNDRNHVAQVTALLQIWPLIAPEQAIELLDYAYADQAVRSFAVRCLRMLSDEDLLLYLLQLVQALKFEPYLDGDLVKFLLERALDNQSIGHTLFWLLRSEMSNPSVSVMFGAVLEAYCRGALPHMNALSRQVQALQKLKGLSGFILVHCDRKKETRERVRQLMQGVLEDSYAQESFRGLVNPLDPSQRILKLRLEKCRFMDSKMRPLWLVFENLDSGAPDIMMMFKNGDDLRQDMLMLQIIRIMDKLWKDEGLDLRMLPYHCLATEHRAGLIEVVRSASTIASIHRESRGLLTATSAFKKGCLLAWIKEHNPDETSLNRAVREFTLSCAGYCVATYVLGIADRHSDNIMVRTNGQLFHIDFGHILGNFKEKFGIKRERAPFVLTHDFVHVITRGHSQKSQEFHVFQQHCEQAFLVLRRRGSLIVSLFGLMLSTGIPELSCEKDLDYLRETLALDMSSEAEALAHFRTKFLEALRNSWATSVNWTAHILAKTTRSPRDENNCCSDPTTSQLSLKQEC